MKTIYLVFLFLVTVYIETFSQTIFINSITTSRQSNGDNGYTLDGLRMAENSRLKLLNASNFGPTGIYPKSISIFDDYGISGSLTEVSTIPENNIFFFGSFDKLQASTQQFTNAEIDSLYNWSLRGGKLIIASGGSYGNYFDTNILSSKWGYDYQFKNPSNFIPTTEGNNTDIFNGPFGNVIAANQGGSLQGFFNSLTSDSKVLATDADGNTTLFMDCITLDLIVADIDGYTDVGGTTSGASINNNQDKFWANTIVFMDKLQPIPFITNVSNNLDLNSTYNNYQWYLNNSSINGATSQNYYATENGSYYVEVTVNGGCKVKSNTIIIDSSSEPDTTVIPNILTPNGDIIVMPNVFTPNGDRINDIFKPTEIKNISNPNLTIYNRWGEAVYNTKDLSKGWNGNYGNKKATDGVYFWILDYENMEKKQETKSGYLHLFR